MRGLVCAALAAAAAAAIYGHKEGKQARSGTRTLVITQEASAEQTYSRFFSGLRGRCRCAASRLQVVVWLPRLAAVVRRRRRFAKDCVLRHLSRSVLTAARGHALTFTRSSATDAALEKYGEPLFDNVVVFAPRADGALADEER
jgi:hypothetical protein